MEMGKWTCSLESLFIMIKAVLSYSLGTLTNFVQVGGGWGMLQVGGTVMTMIPLPPDLEAAVQEAAQARGISETQFILDAVQHELQNAEIRHIVDSSRSAAGMEDEEAMEFAVNFVRGVRQEMHAPKAT